MKKTIIIILSALMAFSATTLAADFSEMSVLTDKKPKKAKAEIKEVTFCVHLHCASCVKKLQENISFEKGVKGLEVSLEKQSVTIKYDASKTSVEALKSAIESLGFKASCGGCAGHNHQHNK